jgi:hypothetical protein
VEGSDGGPATGSAVGDDSLLAVLSVDRPSFLTNGWDPMLVELTAASPVLPRGQDVLASFGNESFARDLAQIVVPVDPMWEENNNRFQISEFSVAEDGVDHTYVPPCSQTDLVLSSMGLLPSPTSDADPEASPWSPCFPSVDPSGSPRSVMDMFWVSLSPTSETGPLGAVDCQQSGGGQLPAQDFDSFRGSCRRPISPVLPRPSARRG